MKPVISRELGWCTVLPIACRIYSQVFLEHAVRKLLCLHPEPVKIQTGFTQAEKDKSAASEEACVHRGSASPRLPRMLGGRSLISIDGRPQLHWVNFAGYHRHPRHLKRE